MAAFNGDHLGFSIKTRENETGTHKDAWLTLLVNAWKSDRFPQLCQHDHLGFFKILKVGENQSCF